MRTLVDAKAAGDAFAARPGYDTASAWADQVGKVFDQAGGYLPTGALPGFMGDYFKVWEGEMTWLFIRASLSDDHLVANGLQAYMESHREIGDVDLYGVNDPAVGAGILKIESDPELSEEQKQAYLGYLLRLRVADPAVSYPAVRKG